MDFENEIRLLGKDIYQKITKFVETNKGDDDKLYTGASLNLTDGRKMYVPFDFPNINEIAIWNYHWDEKLQKEEGDIFKIFPNSDYGFLVNITIYGLDKGTLCLIVGDKGSNHVKLTEEVKEIIRNYMTQLSNQIPLLEYDKEATHQIENFTLEAQTQYYIQRYNSENEKLSGTGETSIPSVQAAVNWWADMISSATISDDQLAKFKDSLSKKIMTVLSHGSEVDLIVDDHTRGYLLEAIKEAGITEWSLPCNTSMSVSVDLVTVCCGLDGEAEEIFNNSVQKEIKHNK